MKNIFLPSFRYQPSAGGLLLGLAFLLSVSASAQNLLKNGSFEIPFPVSDPTAGWALVYVDGGPGDFAIAGQTTEASAPDLPTHTALGGGRGAQFRAATWNYAHAYFNQVVTNLTPGAVYRLNITKMKSAFKYTDEGPAVRQKVYTCMISGSSSNAVHGYSTNIGPYSLTITAGTSQIEVQLHMWKDAMTEDIAEDFKSFKCMAYFDEYSLTQTP